MMYSRNVFVENADVMDALIDVSEYPDGGLWTEFCKEWWLSKRAMIGFHIIYIELP